MRNQAAIPLVISLHGGGSNAEAHERFTGLRTTAKTEGFALLSPTGFSGTWNAGSCCAPSVIFSQNHKLTLFSVDHVGAIIDILDRVEAQYPAIDPSRVYVVGHSNGGMLAHRLACEHADRIAAIASTAATMMDVDLDADPARTIYTCAPVRPVPVLVIAGSADQCTPFNGGVSQGAAGGTRAPVADTVDFWSRNNQCLFATTPLDPTALRPSYNQGAAHCQQHNLCADSATVELCVIDGGGHIWPGNGIAVDEIDEKCGGTENNDLPTNTYVWDFFKNHPLP
ncbi:alpha/beta fold hydrolase [Sinimarinibacterium sp. NLF-5-8]|nr:alpha/beta fold hydrolase [Sinimarinibacterium sp. NLF-5-8]